MGSPKQHLKLGSESFLDRICRTLKSLASPLSPLIFVGSPADDTSPGKISELGGTWIANHEIDLGPLHSIHLALEKIPFQTGFLLWPVDHPLVKPGTIDRILQRAEECPERFIIPSFENRRGHPSRFPPWARKDLLTAPPDQGARHVLHAHPEMIEYVLVTDPWVTRNLNTPERYREALESLKIPIL